MTKLMRLRASPERWPLMVTSDSWDFLFSRDLAMSHTVPFSRRRRPEVSSSVPWDRL